MPESRWRQSQDEIDFPWPDVPPQHQRRYHQQLQHWHSAFHLDTHLMQRKAQIHSNKQAEETSSDASCPYLVLVDLVESEMVVAVPAVKVVSAVENCYTGQDGLGLGLVKDHSRPQHPGTQWVGHEVGFLAARWESMVAVAEVAVVAVDLVADLNIVPPVFAQLRFATEDQPVSPSQQYQLQHNEPRCPSWVVDQDPQQVSLAEEEIHAGPGSSK